MTSDPDIFRQRVTWFRNSRDWTKEQRDDAIARAIERVNGRELSIHQASARSLASLVPEQFEIEILTQNIEPR